MRAIIIRNWQGVPWNPRCRNAGLSPEGFGSKLPNHQCSLSSPFSALHGSLTRSRALPPRPSFSLSPLLSCCRISFLLHRESNVVTKKHQLVFHPNLWKEISLFLSLSFGRLGYYCVHVSITLLHKLHSYTREGGVGGRKILDKRC